MQIPLCPPSLSTTSSLPLPPPDLCAESARDRLHSARRVALVALQRREAGVRVLDGASLLQVQQLVEVVVLHVLGKHVLRDVLHHRLGRVVLDVCQTLLEHAGHQRAEQTLLDERHELLAVLCKDGAHQPSHDLRRLDLDAHLRDHHQHNSHKPRNLLVRQTLADKRQESAERHRLLLLLDRRRLRGVCGLRCRLLDVGVAGDLCLVLRVHDVVKGVGGVGEADGEQLVVVHLQHGAVRDGDVRRVARLQNHAVQATLHVAGHRRRALVENGEGGLVEDQPRHRHALHLAEAEHVAPRHHLLCAVLLKQVAQINLVEDGLDAGTVQARVAVLRRVRQLLAEGARDVVRLLRQVVHAALVVVQPLRQLRARLRDVAALDVPQAAEAAEDGALACAVVARQQQGVSLLEDEGQLPHQHRAGRRADVHLVELDAVGRLDPLLRAVLLLRRDLAQLLHQLLHARRRPGHTRDLRKHLRRRACRDHALHKEHELVANVAPQLRDRLDAVELGLGARQEQVRPHHEGRHEAAQQPLEAHLLHEVRPQRRTVEGTRLLDRLLEARRQHRQLVASTIERRHRFAVLHQKLVSRLVAGEQGTRLADPLADLVRCDDALHEEHRPQVEVRCDGELDAVELVQLEREEGARRRRVDALTEDVRKLRRHLLRVFCDALVRVRHDDAAVVCTLRRLLRQHVVVHALEVLGVDLLRQLLAPLHSQAVLHVLVRLPVHTRDAGQIQLLPPPLPELALVARHRVEVQLLHHTARRVHDPDAQQTQQEDAVHLPAAARRLQAGKVGLQHVPDHPDGGPTTTLLLALLAVLSCDTLLRPPAAAATRARLVHGEDEQSRKGRHQPHILSAAEERRQRLLPEAPRGGLDRLKRHVYLCCVR
eukprot:Rhum_TRINITY_DN15101_c4_g2::Rhum_TRINITY_DN15101_c4_g2_i3::g.139292::m.139292